MVPPLLSLLPFFLLLLRPRLPKGPKENLEQRVLIQETLGSVSQLLQASHCLPELTALLPVLFLQALPLPLQRHVLCLQGARVKRQAPVVAPQLRQLLREMLASEVQCLNLALECQELCTEEGAGPYPLSLAGSFHWPVTMISGA